LAKGAAGADSDSEDELVRISPAAAAKKASAAFEKEKKIFAIAQNKAQKAAVIAMRLHKKEQKADAKDAKKLHEAAEKAAAVAAAAKANAKKEAQLKAELKQAAAKALAEAKNKAAVAAQDRAKAKAAADERKKAEKVAQVANAAAKAANAAAVAANAARKKADAAAKEAEDAAKAAKASRKTRSYLTMRVINLNYKKLIADKKLLAAFKKTFQAAVIDGPPFGQEAKLEIAEGPIKGWAVVALKIKPPKDVPLELWGFSMKSFMGGGIQCMEYTLANVPNLKSALDNPQKPAQVEKFKLVDQKKWDKLHDNFVGKFK
jgi:hypothetical protein